MRTSPPKHPNRLLWLALGTSASLAAGCLDGTPAASGADDDETDETYIPLADDKAAAPLVFTGACEPGVDISIAAVGDVLLHGALRRVQIPNATADHFTRRRNQDRISQWHSAAFHN